MSIDVIAQPLEHLLVTITMATHNYGLSILLFTLLVRLALAPFNLAQLRSGKVMAALGPHLRDLRERYGADRERLTAETMALYKEHKVSPLSSIVPLLIQLPILWGLYSALTTLNNVCYPLRACSAAARAIGASNIFHSAFLWIPNLGHPDPLHVLPIAAGVFQWVQSRMMAQPAVDPQMQQMAHALQFVPFIIVFFAWRYQAGLGLYWVCSTVVSIALQYTVYRDAPTGLWGQLPLLGQRSATVSAARTVTADAQPLQRSGARTRKRRRR